MELRSSSPFNAIPAAVITGVFPLHVLPYMLYFIYSYIKLVNILK